MILFTLVFAACVEEYELDAPPVEGEAVFTSQPQGGSPNYVDFSNNSSAFLKKWDFGNGSTAEGDNVTAYYPFKGDYTVTLTVYTSGGSTSTSETVTIDQTDPEICNVEILQLLTGGCDVPEGKTWVIDAGRAGHFGVGPATAAVGGPTYTPDWYTAGPNEKEGGGMYDDEFTFFLNQSKFVQETNGNVYLNGAQASNFAGATEAPVGDFTAPYTAPDNLNYSISQDGDGNQFINITNGGFIGYATGVSQYQILSITEDEMFIRFRDAANADLAWYHRLIRKGYSPEPPPPPATSTLPIDFEGDVPPFNGFGGSTYQVVDNPDASGINTSAKVGEYVKGLDGNWAGIETTLDGKIDFSTHKFIKYKVYSPVTGRALFKLESADGTATALEVFADVTKTNEWEELTFDFSAAASDTYDKIAMFLDFDNNNGGTFYIDDIRQATPPIALPIDFESQEPVFTTFGGSSYAVVDNPDASGINTSAKVAETVHGGETWAGLFVDLDEPLDLSTMTTISVKVYAPQTGTFRLKLENIADNTDFLEVDADVTTANTWVEVQFDVSSAASGTYARVVVFPGWNVSNAGTFYFDDISQQ